MKLWELGDALDAIGSEIAEAGDAEDHGVRE